MLICILVMTQLSLMLRLQWSPICYQSSLRPNWQVWRYIRVGRSGTWHNMSQTWSNLKPTNMFPLSPWTCASLRTGTGLRRVIGNWGAYGGIWRNIFLYLSQASWCPFIDLPQNMYCSLFYHVCTQWRKLVYEAQAPFLFPSQLHQYSHAKKSHAASHERGNQTASRK